jgi:hypothetical protein
MPINLDSATAKSNKRFVPCKQRNAQILKRYMPRREWCSQKHIFLQSYTLLYIALSTLSGCVSIDNRFLDINNKHYYKNWLVTAQESYGEGTYFVFEAVDFSVTGESSPSLERLKKLIRSHKNKPMQCKASMEIIDESRNLFEGGGESIYIRCGK